MTTIAILRRFWPAIPVLLLVLWAARLEGLRSHYQAELVAERSARALDAERGRAAIAQAEAGFAKAQAGAAATYADRLGAQSPIILRSTDTVREYAQTDAGRARCLGPDRVRGLDALDAALFPVDPAGTGGGGSAVPADGGGAPGGR